MRYLSGVEAANLYLNEAVKIALMNSSCLRARCGSIIVSNNEIIGRGFNSPPGNLESQRRCLLLKKDLDNKVTDKTCCMHVEQRAIFDALRRNPEKLEGSRLYFARLGADDIIEMAGNPYCTICSKSALDVGIKEFVLFHKKGIFVYNTDEYNEISFNYKGE